MPRKRILQTRIRIRRYPKRRSLDIMRELVELFRIKQDLAQSLVPQHLPQYHTRVQRNVLVLVSGQGSKEDLAFARDVFDCGPARADLSAQEVVEYLDDVFAGFEVEFGDVGHEEVQEVGAVGFLCELCQELGYGFCKAGYQASEPQR